MTELESDKTNIDNVRRHNSGPRLMSREEFLSSPQGQQRVQQMEKTRQAAEKQAEYEASEGGRIGVIGENSVKKANEVLRKYKQGKAKLEQRIIDNELYWRQRYWEKIRKKTDDAQPEPTTAWLFNTVANKHAAAMDNYPEPNVLAREEADTEDARMLSDILPVVLEQAGFEQVYSDAWWYKLIKGTSVYGVRWNKLLNNGLGNVDIKKIDILSLFWEPGIQDIQKSRHLFIVELCDNELLEQQYPFLKGTLTANTVDLSQYIYDDSVDTSEKSAVVDWYYKLHDGTREILHYCKYVNGQVLYASENDPYYRETGFYGHGKYPVVVDVLFPEEGTPMGFSYVDVVKDAQTYIDKLNQVILKNALMASKARYFIKDGGGVNEEEFADWGKDFVHCATGQIGDEAIRQIVVRPLDSIYYNVLQGKIDELKETSGNRDFSQGSTAGGVTAASAIAALQEAGGKLDRDAIKSAYRAYTEICYMTLELIRQFYDEPRQFRIVGERGAIRYATYQNSRIKPQYMGQEYGVDLGYRMPIFDIKVVAARKSAFSRISQNELAKELYSLGFFNPDVSDQVLCALSMMDFEGKDEIEQKIAENGTLLTKLQQTQQMLLKLAMVVDAQNGTRIMEDYAAALGVEQPQMQPTGISAGGSIASTSPLDRAIADTAGTTADKARTRAQQVAQPD